ncbi:MAG: hypothetical protein L0Z62_33030 [Gemmataceae bacterium]|nr:hypothetical protein [Gemmataceae bacterium]
MHDSDTYQAILDEGAVKQAHKMLLRLGQKRFGPASAEVVAGLKAIEDLERLERMSDRVLEASSWEQFLQTP